MDMSGINTREDGITIESGKPTIRGLGIRVWEIYRCMAFDGLTDEAILQKYPDLKPEDLIAVREYVAARSGPDPTTRLQADRFCRRISFDTEPTTRVAAAMRRLADGMRKRSAFITGVRNSGAST